MSTISLLAGRKTLVNAAKKQLSASLRYWLVSMFFLVILPRSGRYAYIGLDTILAGAIGLIGVFTASRVLFSDSAWIEECQQWANIWLLRSLYFLCCVFLALAVLLH